MPSSHPVSPSSSPPGSPPGAYPVAASDDHDDDDASATTPDAALPEDLRRHLQQTLERQNVGSIYVPMEVVWAVGIGGALISAAVTLSPWTCFVKRSVQNHPFDPASVMRERAASLPSSSSRRPPSPGQDDLPRRRTSSPAAKPPDRQNSASSASSASFDSAVAGLHSIMRAPKLASGARAGTRREPRRHVSFQLSEDQESLASLSDVELDGAASALGAAAVVPGRETDELRRSVEEELAVEHKDKKHSIRRRWCPLCSKSRKKSPPPTPPSGAPPPPPSAESALHALIAQEFASPKSTRRFPRPA